MHRISKNALDKAYLCCCAQEYSAEAIHAVLRELTPANLRIMLASKQFKVSCLPIDSGSIAGHFVCASPPCSLDL
jgi:hypothetical protein